MKLKGEGRLSGLLREKVYECSKCKVIIAKALVKVMVSVLNNTK
jgi:hypothetical protein